MEELRQGDLILTVSGEMKPVVWIGCRTVDCRRHAPHAFGQEQPERALGLSPDHAVYVDRRLYPVGLLVNKETVMRVEAGLVTYWHAERAAHDVVFAEGLACETYPDTGGRTAFGNGGSVLQLHPVFVGDRASAGAELDRLRGRLVGSRAGTGRVDRKQGKV